MKKVSSHEQFGFLLGQLIRSLNLLNKENKVCYGLTLPQCYTIEALGQYGDQTMQTLSEYLGVTISTTTRVVDVLVRDRLLTRQRNRDDRRQVVIRLTPGGEEMFSRLQNCHSRYSKQVLDRIPGDRRETVLESLHLLYRAVTGGERGKPAFSCCTVPENLVTVKEKRGTDND